MNLIVSPAASTDLVVGDDGQPRCPWGDPAGEREYHDTEWGRPISGTAAYFERLSLEAFQSGLSWSVILRKRPRFREVFEGFDPSRVATFGPADVHRLLADHGIVRNRAKIEATIANARVVLDLDRPLAEVVWAHAPAHPEARNCLADVPASTGASVALARELKRRGFRFVGPTTAYALMQAVGMVDDHLVGCVARPSTPTPADGDSDAPAAR